MSNRRKAIEIYSANPNSTRKNMIQMFITQLGLGSNTASTYYQHCKKAVPIVPIASVSIETEVKATPSKKEPYDYGEDFVVPAFLVKSYQRLGWID